MGPWKNRKTGTLKNTENQDPSGTLENLENRDLTGTLRKPKKWDTVPQWGSKIGKGGPNLTLEKLFNCKSTFIYLLFARAKGDRI